MIYFVDIVDLERLVEIRVHAIEHGHDLHGRQQATRGREPDHVAEENRTTRHDLAQIHHGLAASQTIGDLFRYHLIEKLIGAFHLDVEFFHALLERLALLLLLIESELELGRLLCPDQHQVTARVVHAQVVDVKACVEHDLEVFKPINKNIRIYMYKLAKIK